MIPNFIKTIKQILWRRISLCEIRNSAAAEKSESEREGEQPIASEFEKSLTWSGCRELDPVYIHPMDAYYRYTTARYYFKKIRTTI